ncbi:hypothetical protein AAC387_Pa03g4449 [Persea americana]
MAPPPSQFHSNLIAATRCLQLLSSAGLPHLRRLCSRPVSLKETLRHRRLLCGRPVSLNNVGCSVQPTLLC